MSQTTNLDWDDDLLAGMAAEPVPPVPVNFSRRLHNGLNRAITTEQLCDSLLGALPSAALELFHALCGSASQQYRVTEQSPSAAKSDS